ncbi:MAG: hypothetical protein RMK84_11715 [Oscillochloridaceae bacterium]|nr:hypothetical protein [Chloroflexaceae bacterium]MDW8390783.1 hypothetical protein [Oscillochloridaceae bacterium]
MNATPDPAGVAGQASHVPGPSQGQWMGIPEYRIIDPPGRSITMLRLVCPPFKRSSSI